LAGWSPLPLPIDLNEHVRLFELEAAQTSLEASVRPRAQPMATVSPKPVSSKNSAPAVARLPDSKTASRVRPADDLLPLGGGEVRCRVLRAGYEVTAGHPSPMGHIVRQERSLAQRAAQNGAVEIIEGGSP